MVLIICAEKETKVHLIVSHHRFDLVQMLMKEFICIHKALYNIAPGRQNALQLKDCFFFS